MISECIYPSISSYKSSKTFSGTSHRKQLKFTQCIHWRENETSYNICMTSVPYLKWQCIIQIIGDTAQSESSRIITKVLVTEQKLSLAWYTEMITRLKQYTKKWNVLESYLCLIGNTNKCFQRKRVRSMCTKGSFLFPRVRALSLEISVSCLSACKSTVDIQCLLHEIKSIYYDRCVWLFV